MSNPETRLATLFERISRIGRSSEQSSDLYPAQWAALRYLAEANRFSRTPKALSLFLGSTKGTVSQTINTLKNKGLLQKVPSTTDARSTDIELTAKGRAQLSNDPLTRFEDKLKTASGARVEELTSALEKILLKLIEENGGRMFGQCKTCTHFRQSVSAPSKFPHRCDLLNVTLSDDDSSYRCIEHEARRSG